MLLSPKKLQLTQLADEVLAKIEDMIILTDEEFNPIDANGVFLEKFGFKDIEQFYEYHTSIRELFFWEKLHYLSLEEWYAYIKNNKNYHVKIKDTKSVRDYHLNVYPLQSHKGYLLVFNDVTEAYRSVETVKEFERLKSNFLANISHEFRTPMNGILGFLELFYYTELSPKQKEYLTMINRSSRVLMNNIEALLDYSQLQSGKLTLNNKFIDLVSLVEKVVKNFAPAVLNGEKQFYTFIDPAIPQEVLLDERKIKQILNALIDNAIKFTPKGGSVIVEVRLEELYESGECKLFFAVKDNGIGIDAKKLPKLLEPFSSEGKVDQRLGIGLALASGLVTLFGSKLEINSQVSKGSSFSFSLTTQSHYRAKFEKVKSKTAYVLELDPRQRNYANTIALYLQGFGYKVSKVTELKEEYITSRDVSIIVSSDETQLKEAQRYKASSALFLFAPKTVTIPKEIMIGFNGVFHPPLLPSRLYERLTKEIDLQLFTHTKKTSVPFFTKKLNILVVEDNFINQKLLRTILEEKGVKVFLANDGVEAVEMADLRKYDLILMDIDLPRKNGIEATKEIKEFSKYNRKTPIIAQTAMAMDGDQERLLSQGLDGYIAKPLKRENLNLLLESFDVSVN